MSFSRWSAREWKKPASFSSLSDHLGLHMMWIHVRFSFAMPSNKQLSEMVALQFCRRGRRGQVLMTYRTYDVQKQWVIASHLISFLQWPVSSHRSVIHTFPSIKMRKVIAVLLDFSSLRLLFEFRRESILMLLPIVDKFNH